ncbi:MAG TPA: hypothetical protein VMR34_05260 [Candidatus Saccharimonadales bacterium]|nr:hypothetical protein [Candidatus Saccharimonadales bacterium]
MSTNQTEALTPPHLYDVIAAAGNHEVKAATLAAMEPDTAYTMTPIYNEVMALQGRNPEWKLHKRTPHDFCSKFASIGGFAELVTTESGATAYRTLDEAERLVLPLVGQLVGVSLNEDPSLVAFFGPTQTNSERGIRPCERRIGLMELLRQSEGHEVSTAVLSDRLELATAHAGNIIGDLVVNNIVSSEASGRGKPTISYSPEKGFEGLSVDPSQASELLIDIVNFLQTYFHCYPDSSIYNETIAQALIDSGQYDEPLTPLIREVSAKTNYLENMRKALKAKRDIDTDNAREVIWATETQLEVINSVLDVVEGIQNPSDDYLDQGLENVARIKKDPKLVKYLMHKAKRDSIGLKRSGKEQQAIRTAIQAVIESSPVPLSKTEVWQALLDSGVILDVISVYQHLNEALDLGNIAMSETRQGYKYSDVGAGDQ